MAAIAVNTKIQKIWEHRHLMEEHKESPLRFQSIVKWQIVRPLNMWNVVSSLAFTCEQSRHSCLSYDLRSEEYILATKSIPARKLR